MHEPPIGRTGQPEGFHRLETPVAGGSRPKACWRCGAAFVCGPADAGGRCWCEALPHAPILDADADCLCPACLTAVSAATPNDPPQPALSPCIKLCRIAPETGLCIGCFRTLDEIAAWAGLSNPARQAIMNELPGRKS